MDIFEPTASQAAFILRRYLKSVGVDISLAVAQECVARVRGYADWNVLAAHINPRADSSASSASSAHKPGKAQQHEYPLELARLPTSTWVDVFESCWPEQIHRAETKADFERLQPMWRSLNIRRNFEREQLLRADFFLALTSAELTDHYRHVAGELGLGKAERGHWVQLVFERRIENRFSLKICPTLNWDGLEVLFLTYEFDHVTGDAYLGEVWHEPVVAEPSESLAEVIARALVVADRLCASLTGWLNTNSFMRTA